jgi:fibronectin type 3 domain-containing protein
VSASNSSCASGFNTEVSSTPIPSCSQGAPGTPTLAINPYSQVQVTWTASTPIPTATGGYDIGRSTTSGGTYTNVGHVSNTTLTFTDSGAVLPLALGTTYFYKVTANGSCSTTSAPASIALACQAPAVPTWPATPITNSAGAITITWNQASGATAYTVWRSTSSGSGYAAISTNQTALNYTDPAAGLINGTVYYYKVSATNTSGTCPASPTQSTAVSLRSCTIPATPTITSARRSGNKQVTLLLPSGPALYNVLRSTTNGSGYASIGTTSGTNYPDNYAANTTPYYYVVTASSDAGGNCSSGNSAQASVPSCTVLTNNAGGASYQPGSDQTAELCIVTCDVLNPSGWWTMTNITGRTLYINGATGYTSAQMPLPAVQNSGWAFYVSSGTSSRPYFGYGNVVSAHTCP